MKPFQFYCVEKFPGLTMANPIMRSMVQPSYFGEKEDIQTTITLIKKNFEGTFSKLKVESGVWRKAVGYIRTIVGNKLEKLDLFGYVHPVEFIAYHDEAKMLMLFQAPRKVCRGVLANLKDGRTGVELCEMEIDLDRVCEICPRFRAVWFRNLSSYVKAAAMSGHQLQNDTLFNNVSKYAEKSSVVIVWNFLGEEHPVMVNGSGAIVLVNDYRKVKALELRLVSDIHDHLLVEARRGPNKPGGFEGNDLLDLAAQ